MSRDPEDSWPTNSASLHKYLYASGDPVNRIDPRGRGDFVEYVFNLSEQALKAIIPITEMVGNFVELQVVPSVEAGVNFAVEAVEVFAEDVELTKKATAVAKAYVCADLALQFAILVMDLNNDVKLTPEQREIYLTTSEIGMTAVCVEQWR
jgi:hypothetical protein